MSNEARLGEKALDVIPRQLPMQYFNGGLRVQVNMLTQVDFSEVPFPKQMDEAIVAKLLPHSIGQAHTSW